MEKRWEKYLKESVRNVEGIKEILHLSEEESEQMKQIIERYPLCINRYYLGLINKNDRNDPIRKMCIPEISEFSKGGQKDTSGEMENTVIQGMQHKYKQTALILSTNQCAMYCRHCFRKRMVGASSDEVAKQLPLMTDYVRRHKEINNVLISGVIPYYIFQCRPVEGVKNQFQVPLLKGIEIVEEARRFMNGQAKSVRFVLSHSTGKIEILGKDENDKMIFKFHQSKYDKNHSRLFTAHIQDGQCWLYNEKDALA